MKNTEGFSSLEFLVTLFFLTIIFFVFGFYVKTSLIRIDRYTEDVSEKENIDRILDEVIQKIKEDSSSESDSKFDPVWDYNERIISENKITLRSLSACVDLNFLDLDIVNDSIFQEITGNGDLSSVLETCKNDEKLLFCYEDLENSVSEEIFNKYFTFYSFPSFNIAEEKSLALLINKVLSSSYGQDILNKRKIMKSNNQLIQNETEYNMLVGIYYEDLKSFVNINQTLNINFIDEDLLKAIVSCPKFEIANVNNKVNTIIGMRENSELQQNDICNVFGISKANELYYYLGTVTWFWEILVEGKNLSCKCIISRSVDSDILGSPEYYIVEKKWL